LESPNLELTIPGDPAPWQSFQRGGQRRNRQTGHWEDQSGYANLKAWQEQIQFYLRAKWGDREPLSGPVCLDAEFFLPWPQAAPRKRAQAIESWYEAHLVKKPDRTNLYKAFEDACQGILFHNDSQVLRGEPRKDILRPTVYAQYKEGYTVMRFRPLEKG